MKIWVLIFYFGLLAQSAFNQNKLTLVAQLPSELEETSALIYYNNSFWTINDSGGEATLYRFNRQGELLSKVMISGAENIDWEALAINDTHLFVGDFGNNFGTRKDLRIYAVKLNQLSKPVADIDFTIDFQYPEQKSWVIARWKTQFDCEAMIATNDNLHLYTKDWKNKCGAHYMLDIEEGIQEAKFQVPLNAEGLITDAALYNGNLYLIGYDDYIPILWLYDFSSLQAYKQRIEITDSYKYQVEGITFYNDTLYITSEKSAVEQSLFFVIPGD